MNVLTPVVNNKYCMLTSYSIKRENQSAYVIVYFIELYTSNLCKRSSSQSQYVFLSGLEVIVKKFVKQTSSLVCVRC